MIYTKPKYYLWTSMHLLLLLLLPVSVLDIFSKPIETFGYLGSFILFIFIVVFLYIILNNLLRNTLKQGSGYFSISKAPGITVFNFFCIALSIVTILLLSAYCLSFFLNGWSFHSLLNTGIFSEILVCSSTFLITNIFLNFKNKTAAYYFSLIATVLVLAFTIAVNARLAWISMGITFVFLFMFFSKISRNNLKKIIPIALVLALVAIFLFNKKMDSAKGRLLVYRITFNEILKEPITGFGVNSFAETYPKLQANYFANNPRSKDVFLSNSIRYAYNEPLQIQYELGIPGTLVFFAILLFLLHNTLRIFKSKNEDPFLIASAMSLLSFILYSLFLYPLRSDYTLFISISAVIPLILFSIKKALKPIRFNSIKIAITLFLITCSLLYIIRITKTIIGAVATNNHHADYIVGADYRYKDLADKYLHTPEYSKLKAVHYWAMGEYDEAINNLKTSINYKPTYENFVALAELYRKNKDTRNALETLQFATNYVPYKLSAKEKLLDVYLHDLKDTLNAYLSAEKILQTDVKINSNESLEIKTKASNFIRKTHSRYLFLSQ